MFFSLTFGRSFVRLYLRCIFHCLLLLSHSFIFDSGPLLLLTLSSTSAINVFTFLRHRTLSALVLLYISPFVIHRLTDHCNNKSFRLMLFLLCTVNHRQGPLSPYLRISQPVFLLSKYHSLHLAHVATCPLEHRFC